MISRARPRSHARKGVPILISACLAARSCQYRSPVSPLDTPEEFLEISAGRLPAINSPQAISLTVRHSGRGHRDLLPGNYGVARRVEPEAKFFNDFSRAPACARAQGGVGSDSAAVHLGRILFVRTKDVANIGSYGENAQCFMCSQSFTDPRDILPQDVPLRLPKCFVSEYQT